jgi:hypothetical protein
VIGLGGHRIGRPVEHALTRPARTPTRPPSAVDEQPTPNQRRIRRRLESLGRDTDAGARCYHSSVVGRLREECLGTFGAARASTRDEPVNLSDSPPETHQHCSPADASCCHSLLLDPDATIDIDLRKRLFLLVAGRGE